MNTTENLTLATERYLKDCAQVVPRRTADTIAGGAFSSGQIILEFAPGKGWFQGILICLTYKDGNIITQ